MKTILSPTGLPDQLAALIKYKRRELMRLINYELLTLFWNVGVTYNQELRLAAAELDAVSQQLTDYYGSILAKNSLKQMGQFAEKFPDFSGVANDTACISWDHHLALLQVAEPQAWGFYTRLTLEQGLSANDLRQKIEDRTFERATTSSRESKKPNRGKNKPDLPIWAMAIDHDGEQVMTDFFREPWLSALCLLAEPANLPENDIDDGEKQLLAVFLQDINTFRQQVNKRLNVELNKFFWTIGKRVEDEISAGIYTDDAMLIANLAENLQPVYGDNFNTEGILQILACARQFTESRIFTRVAYLVNWVHIPVLMQLPTLQQQLFYARITALQGLSVTALQQSINQFIDEHTSGAIERELQVIETMRNAPVIKSVEKKGNKTTIINTTMVNYGPYVHDSLAIGNMFKNDFLLDFMKPVRCTF